MTDELGAIRLQFVAGEGLLSRAIAWRADGLSHVDAILPPWWPDERRRGWLLGARLLGPHGAGVRIRPPGYVAAARRRITVTLPVDAAAERAFYLWLGDQIGKPYDWPAILGFVAGRDWRWPGRWECMELIARGLEVAEVFRWPLYLEASRITPGAGALVLSALTPFPRM